MTYNTFKLTIFDIIVNSSRTIIEMYLHKLSTDFDIKYSVVVQDFNEYSGNRWHITT